MAELVNTMQHQSSKAPVVKLGHNVIQCVYDACEKEKRFRRLIVPLEDVARRTATYTRTSIPYVASYTSPSGTQNDSEEFPVDISVRKKIYKIVRDYYNAGLWTLSQISLGHIKAESGIEMSDTDFENMIFKMGFQHQEINERTIFLEAPQITFERFHYLKKIKQLRKTHENIFYVDQRYVTTNFTSAKRTCCMNRNDYVLKNEIINGYILNFIASKNSYLNGIFYNQFDEEDFEKWMIDIVLPILPPSSCIIMQQLPENSDTDKSIMPYNSKDDMIKLLLKHNVPFRAVMHKSELFELIARCVPKQKNKMALDKVFRSHGHAVLQLPATLYDLHIADPVWEKIIFTLGCLQEPTNTPEELKKAILRLLTNMPDDWRTFSDKIESLEQELYGIEVETDAALEKIMTSIKELNKTIVDTSNMTI